MILESATSRAASARARSQPTSQHTSPERRGYAADRWRRAGQRHYLRGDPGRTCAARSAFTTVQLQGAAIRQQARQLKGKYREIVIDVGGRDTGSLRAALTVTDVILIPFQPRSVDLWAAEAIAALVREAREVNETLKAYALLNIADAQGRDNDDAAGALAAVDGIELLPGVIGRRKAFPNAFSAGLSVFEQSPRDPKACSELMYVVDTLYIHRRDNDYQRAQTG